MDNLIVLSYNWNYLERFLGVPYPGAGHSLRGGKKSGRFTISWKPALVPIIQI